MAKSVARQYLDQTIVHISKLDVGVVEQIAKAVDALRWDRGRLFFCGNGGGAAHASHAAADFRKIARIESYALGDNLAELTAQINDWTWEDCYADLLRSSRFGPHDGLFVFSVGGGDSQTSLNLQAAVVYARKMGGQVFAVTGREGTIAAQCSYQLVMGTDTPQTEGLQAVVWHLLVSMLAPK